MPGDFEGGMMLFIIAVAITLVELYVVKKANLSISLRRAIRDPREFACKGIGGEWHPNRDSNDPCCKLPTGINKVDVDGFPICRGTRVPFP